MVDLSTAMAAAAASDKRRGGGRDGDKKRPGGKVGTEPFDPVDHVEKEKADTASMWLVLVFAVIVALLMRYGLMPVLEGPASVLWSLPLLLVFTIPTLHKILLRKFAERYTFGNWFRASFLYIFTWLAISFIVVNPPLADLSPPEVAGKVILMDIDDPDAWQTRSDYIGMEEGETTAERTGFAFAVRDNLDAIDVEISIRLLQDGHEIQTWNGTAGEMRGDWDAVSSNVSKVKSKATDVPVLIEFDEGLKFGSTYTVELTMNQDGEPWDLEKVQTWTFQVGPHRA